MDAVQTPYPHLARAPIVEALLDIGVARAQPISLNDLAGFHEQVRERFPLREERRLDQIQVQVTGENSTQFSRTGQVTGYLFRSPATSKVVQTRGDGFSLSKLRPYESWQLLRDEAEELWGRYRAIAKPDRVTRVSLRYINRMELPLPLTSFDEYFRTIPQVAPGLPQGLANFFLRLVIPHPTFDAIGIVHQTFEAPTSEDRLPFIFDIDVFKVGDYDPADETIWADLARLRDFKNDVFFRSITEKTRELFL